jgi:hypothetical protein
MLQKESPLLKRAEMWKAVGLFKSELTLVDRWRLSK